MKKTNFCELSSPGELNLSGSWSNYWTRYTPSIWNNSPNSIKVPVSGTLYGTQEASNKYLLNQWNNRWLLTATQVGQLRSHLRPGVANVSLNRCRAAGLYSEGGVKFTTSKRRRCTTSVALCLIHHRRPQKPNPIHCVPALPNPRAPWLLWGAPRAAALRPGALRCGWQAGGCSWPLRRQVRSQVSWETGLPALVTQEEWSRLADSLQTPGVNAFLPVMLCQIRRSLSCPSYISPCLGCLRVPVVAAFSSCSFLQNWRDGGGSVDVHSREKAAGSRRKGNLFPEEQLIFSRNRKWLMVIFLSSVNWKHWN